MALTVLSACSATMTTEGTRSDSLVTSDSQLSFTVTDAPAMPGLMFITATAVGDQGKVVVSSTRYGSVCATTVTAHADVATNTITLAVTYGYRDAICTADLRAVMYRAEIGALAPGMYDVKVIHTNPDGSTGVVLAQRVKVG